MSHLHIHKFILTIILIFFGVYFYSVYSLLIIHAAVGDIVIGASDITDSNIHGQWTKIQDNTTSGGVKIKNTNNRIPKLTEASANPSNYFEATFYAEAGKRYQIWFRMEAENNDFQNDSIFVQFSDSLDTVGSPHFRIGTTDSLIGFLEENSTGISGWGWNDNNYNGIGPAIQFESTGNHTIRVQQREDGVAIDEIVLSSSTYLTQSPGLTQNDSTFVQKDTTPSVSITPTPTIPLATTPTTAPVSPTPTVQTLVTQSSSISISTIQPELPREYINTNYPTLSSGRTVRTVEATCGNVRNCYTNLQTAIDDAVMGDEIVLRAGVTFAGPITLKNKTSGSSWIIIRSSNLSSLPSEGNRVSPLNAHDMPKITSAVNLPALQTENNAHHYRIVGVEFTERSPSDDSNVLIELGIVGVPSADKFSSNIIFDRVYIHGSPLFNTKRGLSLNNKVSAIIDSYISDIHVVGQDAQAVAGFNGPGPFKIVNNYLEASGENILFGGDDPKIQGLIPSDIEIRGNYIFKPLSWRFGDSNYNGRRWSVKNLFELKNAQRVLIDGNIMENNWADGQSGIAILFNTTNQGGNCSWCAVTDVTFSNNIIRHSGGGVSIQGNDYTYPQSTGRTERIKIYNNLFEDLDGNRWKDLRTNEKASDYLFSLSSGASEPGPNDIEINHNTATHSGNMIQVDKLDSSGNFLTKARFTYINNVAGHNLYGVFGTGVSFDSAAITGYFPNVTFTKNSIIGQRSSTDTRDWSQNYTNFPGNFFPKSRSELEIFPGTDNKNIGADTASINSITRGVISGNRDSTVSPTPIPPPPPAPVTPTVVTPVPTPSVPPTAVTPVFPVTPVTPNVTAPAPLTPNSGGSSLAPQSGGGGVSPSPSISVGGGGGSISVSSAITNSQTETQKNTSITLNLTKTLSVGLRDSEVERLQVFLIQTGYLEPNNNSGFFGQMTRTAVQKYQCAKGLTCSGTEATTGYGMVGAKTRALLAGGTSAPVTTPSTSTGGLALTRTVYMGAKGADIVSLQNFLIAKGYLTAGSNSGFFGQLTKTAVQKFQCEKMGICSGSEGTTGYGLVGAKTRSKMQQ